jgi:two-component system nitrogen regulation sensor histidine kinase GlnL
MARPRPAAGSRPEGGVNATLLAALADLATEARSPYPGVDLLSVAVLFLTGDRRVVHVNPAAENLLEVSRSRLVGTPIGAVFADARLLAGAIDHAIAAGTSYTEQEIELAVVGKAKSHLAVTATPVAFGDIAVIVELRQIDQQIKLAREERRLEQQQANRELIRNLAHEIKNPLGGIRGAAQLLERELAQPQLAEYTQVIIGEADRLQSLVNRLLTPHRVPAYRRINVHEVLVRVKGLVQAEFPSVGIATDFDISLPDIEMDAEQMTQAILNVVRNAAQALATTSDPAVVLKTRVARYVTLVRKLHRLALEIDVEDNGPGVAPELRDRMFYPLVSGREGGSGLGLTIAQTYVAQHGGTIDCESEPGRTVFRILLPLEATRPPPGSA